LRDTNRLSEAERLFQRALAIFENSYGPEHPSTVTVRDHVARMRARKSKWRWW
jgi:hypothetical protein